MGVIHVEATQEGCIDIFGAVSHGSGIDLEMDLLFFCLSRCCVAVGSIPNMRLGWQELCYVTLVGINLEKFSLVTLVHFFFSFLV